MIVSYLCKKLIDPLFIKLHKQNIMDFTRERKLNFMNVFILIFCNTVKSLQIMLNEFILLKNYTFTITASAFSQARRKLKYTAFKELNKT